jgi:hypothetical protein
VPDVNGFYLYGDRISSINQVKEFRKELNKEV